MRKHLAMGLVMMGLAFSACSDDEEPMQEPVEAQTTQQPPAAPPAPPAVPESTPEPKQAQQEGEGEANQLYVLTEALNVRSGPGVSHGVVDRLEFGQAVTAIKAGSWVQIGQGRYVWGEYVAKDKPATPIQNPVVHTP